GGDALGDGYPLLDRGDFFFGRRVLALKGCQQGGQLLLSVTELRFRFVDVRFAVRDSRFQRSQLCREAACLLLALSGEAGLMLGSLPCAGVLFDAEIEVGDLFPERFEERFQIIRGERSAACRALITQPALGEPVTELDQRVAPLP